MLLQTLNIIHDLMLKGLEIYLDHFARLGVFTKVLALAGPTDSDDENKKIKEDGVRQCF